MLEIEQKYANADFAVLEARLAALGAGPPQQHEEADHYFNGPDRDFARTDEAFRMRRIGEANFLTFKGPKRAGPIKIRPELEIPLPPGDEAARQHAELLVQLGYRPVVVVRKRRTTYPLERRGLHLHVCLDEVAELGRFAEVEVVAPEDQAAQASAVLAEVVGELGLHRVETGSYLGLLLRARAAAGGSGRPAPRIASTITELGLALGEARRQRQTIGLVPTMGALHEGHLALIREARSRNDLVAVSIFVNPMQFGPNEDLSRYPRPIEADVALCESAGVDLIFRPSVEEIYPPGCRTQVEVTGLQDVLEGAARPGHFRGVTTVVLKLFNLMRPDRAYFGQKDAQQARIVRQMVCDLNVPVEIVVCPTIREPDGLALSSRNRYLDPDQRARAVVLSQALTLAEALYRQGTRDPAQLEQVMARCITATPDVALEYAAVVDPLTLGAFPGPIEGQALALVAARIGSTRLIDNQPLG